MRIEIKQDNGTTGWVTMSGNQGTVYLEAFSPLTAFITEMYNRIQETAVVTQGAQNFFKTKIAELQKAGAQGPLAEVRAELLKLRPQAIAGQQNVEALNKKVATAKKNYALRERAEANAHIEAREKKAADAIMSITSAKVETMEANAKQLEEAASQLTVLHGTELEGFAIPATVQEEVERLAISTAEAVAEAKAVIQDQQSKVGKVINGPMAEAKRELQKMWLHAEATGKSCESCAEAVRAKCGAIVDKKITLVSAALRELLQQKGMAYDAFFMELAGPGCDRIPEETFCRYLEELESPKCPPEQARLICRHIEVGGVGRRSFCRFLQQYFVVVKAIAITNCFDIGKAKTIRKAEIDEVIEILEGPCVDTKVGLTRIKGKSLGDGLVGWISVRGNQGTPFLQEVEKPFYQCTVPIVMDEDFKGGPVVRTLRKDEVIELIEGPRKETFPNAVRLRGKACLDSVSGWFTIKDKKGVIHAEANNKYYICTASVVMTDEKDINTCKVIRKMCTDELFIILEDPEKDEEAGITRVKGRAVNDDNVGWITVRGNAGTVYAEASTKHYTVLQDTPLHKKFATDSSEIVRTLAKDEAMLLLEGPREETFSPEIRVKGKALSDGTVGWISLRDQNVRAWSPYYTCQEATPIHDAFVVEGAQVVRQLEGGEAIELMQGPLEEESTKEIRMKGRAQKDGTVGWVTIKDKDGKVLLES